MSKICIICRTVKTIFSAEHVFQKTIGGQYTVHNVCKECNEDRLGPNIDVPFLNHILISMYRFVHEQSRNGRGIRNPLQGETVTINGTKHLITLTKDLQIKSYQPRQYPNKKDIVDGKDFKVTVDGSDADKINEIIQKLAKKSGRLPEEFKIRSIETTDIPERTHTIESNNMPLALGFAKILYETAVDCVPSYFDDVLAIKFSQMLHSGEFDPSLQNEMQPDIELINEVNSNLYTNLIKAKDEHLVLIAGYPGIGLIGFIKIYDLTHVMILSRNQKYYGQGATLVSTNFKKKKLGIYIQKGIPHSKFTIVEDGSFDLDRLKKEFVGNAMDSDYPLYDRQGNVIFKSNIDINRSNFTRKIVGDFKTQLDCEFHVNGFLCIKSKILNQLIPLESVILNCKVNVAKIRG